METAHITVTPHDLGTFLVSSRTTHGQEYLVDLAYMEEPWRRPVPKCSCWPSYCHGRVCAHIVATVEFEKERLGL